MATPAQEHVGKIVSCAGKLEGDFAAFNVLIASYVAAGWEIRAGLTTISSGNFVVDFVQLQAV